jgi:transcriptional regulator with XRE-family HTH domain
MKTEEAFGVILKKIRHKENISQSQLALDSELDRTFISLLERGKRQPSLSSVFKISKALNVEPDEMIRSVKDLINENNKP